MYAVGVAPSVSDEPVLAGGDPMSGPLVFISHSKVKPGKLQDYLQVHPDAESLDLHLRIFFDKLQAKAFATLDTDEINVYGAPSDATLEMLSQMPSQIPGLRVRVLAEYQGGFLRPQPL
jgi:hypothetical protein